MLYKQSVWATEQPQQAHLFVKLFFFRFFSVRGLKPQHIKKNRNFIWNTQLKQIT